MEEINDTSTQDEINKIKFVKLREPVKTTCFRCGRRNILCKFILISEDLISHYRDPICSECFQGAMDYKNGEINWDEFLKFKAEQFQKGMLERRDETTKLINEIENKKPSLKNKFFNLFKKKLNDSELI